MPAARIVSAVTTDRAPRAFLILGVIALLEGLALLGYAVYDTIQALRIGATGPTDVSNPSAIVIQIVIFAIFGIGLLLVARGWFTGRRWPRAPFILAQLIALVVGSPLISAQGDVDRVVGFLTVGIAVAGMIVIFTPTVIREFSNPRN